MTQRHIEIFSVFVENLSVEQVDVVMTLLVQSLIGEARKWFKYLLKSSITTLEELEDYFT